MYNILADDSKKNTFKNAVTLAPIEIYEIITETVSN